MSRLQPEQPLIKIIHKDYSDLTAILRNGLRQQLVTEGFLFNDFINKLRESNPRDYEIFDSYRPHESVTAKIVGGADGAVVQIVDSYRPPAQKDDVERWDCSCLPGGAEDSLPPAWATPANFLFEDDDRRKYSDYMSENERAGFSQHWLRRLGVCDQPSPYSFNGNASLKLFLSGGENPLQIRFPEIRYDSGTIYYGTFGSLSRLKDVAYGAILTAHAIPEYFSCLEEGDHLWVEVKAGFNIVNTNIMIAMKKTPEGFDLILFPEQLNALAIDDLGLRDYPDSVAFLTRYDKNRLTNSNHGLSLFDLGVLNRSHNRVTVNWDNENTSRYIDLQTIGDLLGLSREELYAKLASVKVQFAGAYDSTNRRD